MLFLILNPIRYSQIYYLINILQSHLVIIHYFLLSVSFAGSLAVLVMIQLIAALSLNNLVSRSDTPPSFLIWPLQGTIWTNILCLTDAPLVGQVCFTHRVLPYISFYNPQKTMTLAKKMYCRFYFPFLEVQASR